jgi:phosphate transport system permease protein
VPLISVLYMLITRGGARLSLEVFTELPPTGFETGGGFGNAMAGTFVMVGIAAAIAVPVGIMAAIFLAELGPDSKLANAARFAAKMLTGLPSILAGVFAYALVVMTTGHLLGTCRWRGPGGADAADRGADGRRVDEDGAQDHEGRRLRHGLHPLPGHLENRLAHRHAGHPHRRDAGRGTRAGETAPLLFTALFSNYWIYHDGSLAVMNPTASLAVLIYNFSGMPFDNQLELAWAASLVLVMIVLVVNIVSRIFGKPKY